METFNKEEFIRKWRELGPYTVQFRPMRELERFYKAKMDKEAKIKSSKKIMETSREKQRKYDLVMLAAEVEGVLKQYDESLAMKMRHEDLCWHEVRQRLEDVVDKIIEQI
jgi:hypothetical protein